MEQHFFPRDQEDQFAYDRGIVDCMAEKWSPAGSDRIGAYSLGYFHCEEVLEKEKRLIALVIYRKRSFAVVPAAFHTRIVIEAAFDRRARAMENFAISLEKIFQTQTKLNNHMIDYLAAIREKHGTKKAAAN